MQLYSRTLSTIGALLASPSLLAHGDHASHTFFQAITHFVMDTSHLLLILMALIISAGFAYSFHHIRKNAIPEKSYTTTIRRIH